ncbi:hypothetical protein EC973_000339 [Apophysomyces ossiformis]|uniref:Galactose oxidase n=1 Tax=Apophysomyces ossiformis TaxID=679940 RepID=A0A8H7BV85_9FUNG|nr:hypothetical protein EC973_000339 [Apophysomyces ossiformis]
MCRKTIFCYGGLNGPREILFKAETYYGFHTLDVSRNVTRNQLMSNWTDLEDDLFPQYLRSHAEQNADFAMVNVPDNAFVVNGGIGYGVAVMYTRDKGWKPKPMTEPLTNNTVKYDGQSWSALPSGPFDQYFGQSGNYVESKQSIYYWGGWSVVQNISADVTFRILNYTTLQWSSSAFSPLPGNSVVRFRHTATMAGDHKIYFIGGTSGYGANDSISMQDILIYDTIADKWNLTKSQGPVTPSQRSMHTTNWIPGTSTLVVYGGAATLPGPNNYTTVPDHCYTYDTVGNQWTQQNPKGQSGPGELYGHSSILIGNSTLLITFGNFRTSGEQPGYAAMFILNLINMSWSEQYDANALNYVLPSRTTNNTVPEATQTPLSVISNTPTIIGAVVGSVVAALIGLSVGVYLFLRKRKTKRATDEAATQNHGNNAQRHSEEFDKSAFSFIKEQDLAASQVSETAVLQSPLVDKPLSTSPLFARSCLPDKPFSESPIMQSYALSPLVDKPFSQSPIVSHSGSKVSIAEKPDSGNGHRGSLKPDAYPDRLPE